MRTLFSPARRPGPRPQQKVDHAQVGVAPRRKVHGKEPVLRPLVQGARGQPEQEPDKVEGPVLRRRGHVQREQAVARARLEAAGYVSTRIWTTPAGVPRNTAQCSARYPALDRC
jgi:hypothetical protein